MHGCVFFLGGDPFFCCGFEGKPEGEPLFGGGGGGEPPKNRHAHIPRHVSPVLLGRCPGRLRDRLGVEDIGGRAVCSSGARRSSVLRGVDSLIVVRGADGPELGVFVLAETVDGRNPFCTTWRPWLKPLLVKVFTLNHQKPLSFWVV